jgi:hypothetical protein
MMGTVLYLFSYGMGHGHCDGKQSSNDSISDKDKQENITWSQGTAREYLKFGHIYIVWGTGNLSFK